MKSVAKCNLDSYDDHLQRISYEGVNYSSFLQTAASDILLDVFAMKGVWPDVMAAGMGW